MKLKQITFAGIDKWTDLSELKKIQKAAPNVEFGVLLSRNWQENGNRYFNPSELYKLRDLGLNLSCHLCGLFGIGTQECSEYTLAKRFNLTEERVRQLKWAALEKMQKMVKS